MSLQLQRAYCQCLEWLSMNLLWLSPWVGKMNRILCCDWLLELARGCYLVTSGLTHVCLKEGSFSLNKSFIGRACRDGRILASFQFFVRVSMSCIRLASRKFELTNQDSAAGKNSGVLTSSWNQASFVTGDGIKYPRKGIYNCKNQTSRQKVKNMNLFVFLSSYFGAKNGLPVLCMATCSQFVEYRQVGY